MCGISGLYTKDNSLDLGRISQMTSCMWHRGPDSDGIYKNEKFGFAIGHQRLSIIDLSSKSAQPYHSKCGRYVMTYNGEIYNYRQLAKKYDLKQSTEGDTEVVIELFAKIGTTIFKEFSGMFALAIFDSESGQLCLARDPRGIKPLYYYFNENNFVFGSELKSIGESGIDLSLNKKSLMNYFNLGFFPKESTVFEEVNKLPQGNYLLWNSGDPKIKKFTSPINCTKSYEIKNFDQAKKELSDRLHEAVRSRLIGDRPVGTFLSGGIDSSLVSYYANLDRRVPINSYNIKIDNVQFDESSFARRIAKKFGTNHHEIEISESNIKDDLVRIIDQIDEPFADSSFIPTYILSQYVKEHITVALSGDGGDELFMGYGYYNWPKRLSSFPFNMKKFWKFFFNHYKLSKNKDHSKYFNFEGKVDMPQHIFSQEQSFFSKYEIKKLFRGDRYDYNIYDPGSVDRLVKDKGEVQSYLDFHNYLPDDLLVKVDRASMLNSLEVRVPFLDNAVVDFAWRLHPNIKLKGAEGKYILKEILCEFLPKELVYRKKWGFSIPLDKWLNNEFDYLIDESLEPELVESCKFLNTEFVFELISEFRNGKTHLYNKIWLLIIFFRWYKRALKD